MEVPIAFELGASGTGGKLAVDVGPLGSTVPIHVLGGDLVRDALVAQSRNQPIEQRCGVVAPDGRGNAFGPQVGANIINQAGRARQAADTVHDPNRVIDCRGLGAMGVDRPCRSGETFVRVAVLEIMPSNHCDQLALRITVTVNVPLSCLDRPVTSEQLDIPQGTTGLVDEPRRPGDERPAS